MSIALELDASGFRVIDTAGQTVPVTEIAQAVAVTKEAHTRGAMIADGVAAQALDFGSVTAGKAIVIKTDGAGEVTVKLNGGSTPIPVNKLLVLFDAGGGYTAATMGNASGVVVTYEVHVFG